MQVIALGVGAAFAKTLNNTNFLITPAKGEAFLLDCGHTATRALAARGVSLSKISSIIVSHLHADHIGGLEEIGFSSYFILGRKTKLCLTSSVLEYLWPMALSAGMGQRLKGADGRFFDAELSTYFEISTMENARKDEFGSVAVTPFRVPHVPGRPCWGFHMEDRETGGRAMFTCDSKLSLQNLETFGAESDIIFHDCQLVGDGPTIHTKLEEILSLPENIQRRIKLVHYEDNWAEFEGKTGLASLARESVVYQL